MSKGPLQARELLKRLRPYGVEALSKRGKGSELILIKPTSPGSRKGPQYPIKHHGGSTEISVPVIQRILDRFNIDPKEFWGED